MSKFRKAFAAVAAVIAVAGIFGAVTTTLAPDVNAGGFGVPGGGPLKPTGPIRGPDGRPVRLSPERNAYYRCVDANRWNPGRCGPMPN